MEKTRRLKTFSIVALIVAVLGLTIAFAALSKTLTINGTGSVDAANWDIHFKNISEPTLTGKATTTGTPTLADNGATINDMKVSLKEPGDKVVYTVDIENAGDINAEIDSITLPTFTTAQSNIINFKAVYTSNNKEIAQGDILESKEVKNVTITIMYKDITDESLLPKEGISVNLKYELHFIQTDKASGSSSQGSGSSSYGTPVKTWRLSDTIDMTYYGGIERQDGTYKDGTLVISGAGDMPDDGISLLYLIGASSWEEFEENYDTYTENDDPIFKYKPYSLIIEEGITTTGANAFQEITTLNNVSLPSTLREISDSSLGEISITSITIPKGVTKIGDCAFLGDRLLQTIYIPSTVTEIGTDSTFGDNMGSVLSSTIYCETEEVASVVRQAVHNSDKPNIVVDPTKFN